MRPSLPALVFCAGWLAGCDAKPEATVALPPEPPAREERLEEPPIALNAEVPVGYPEGPAAQRIGGTVILKLFVDSAGRVVPESTGVQESSGYPALDSAALAAVPRLRFAPGLRDGAPIATRFLQPVNFRAPPPPGGSPTP
ncbi:MAG: energy transducer TonB [Gemmatimonadales bacterium]